MAEKKNVAPSKPVVSRVPLPVSDSALVIDLPDGQKLVVGKMGQGTVIEVATWRGVGRPDSRTSRMMFGMSSAVIEETEENQNNSGQNEYSESLITKIVNYPMNLVRWLFNIQSTPKPKKNKDGSKKLLIDSSNSSSSSGKKLKQTILPTAYKIFTKIMKLVSTLIDSLVKKLKEKKNSKPNVGIEKSMTSGITNDDLDIEKWLDSLNTKSKKALEKPATRTVVARKTKN
jgi:hypothetical protein